jgi:RimJ/RimL family protein N-acetyltransferase
MADVRLEPLSDDHRDEVAALLTDPDVLRFTRVPDEPPPGFAEEWIARYEAGRRDGTREGFAALDGDGAFVGLALAPHIDREAQELELGYIVAPFARGRGHGAALLRRLTDWAFADGMIRSYLLIDVGNPASERVAERAGYRREGVLRSAYLKPGRRADVGVWSRLPSDPPPARASGETPR